VAEVFWKSEREFVADLKSADDLKLAEMRRCARRQINAFR
jgi:hypothetical protein